jgi:hypothetical protein
MITENDWRSTLICRQTHEIRIAPFRAQFKLPSLETLMRRNRLPTQAGEVLTSAFFRQAVSSPLFRTGEIMGDAGD